MSCRRIALLVLALFVPAALLATACSKHRPGGVTGPEGIASSPGAPGAGGLRSREDISGTEIDERGPAGRIRICHVGEDGVKHIITVNENAWRAHSKHGDVRIVDADGDGHVARNDCMEGGDCDDQDPSVGPGSVELCDGIDNDCDGQVDEGVGVVGSQTADILRDPARLSESAMGNLVADALRLRYTGVDAALVNSGGLRQDLRFAPTGAELPGEITCGELFGVLPFGNRTVILTLTGAQLEQAFLNGLSPKCNPAVSTGRFPQISGIKVSFHCNGPSPVVTGMWRTPQGAAGPQIPIGPTDTIRLATVDFLAAGGDGYTVFQAGTNVLEPGETILEVLAAYVAANSPASSVVDGRIQFLPPVAR